MIVEKLPEGERLWDVCIVGSGPVGMSMALEFDNLGHKILVLESGGREFDLLRGDDSRAILANPKTHAPMEIASSRAFGGTSWIWGGRSVPLDDIDFERRCWVPDSDWPIGHDAIRPWYARACEYLLCGKAHFELAPQFTPAQAEGIEFDHLERWSIESRLALIHRDAISASDNVVVSLNSTVVDFEFDRDVRRVESLVVAVPGGRRTVRARQIVLALGGVETTRLLLAVQRDKPNLFGGIGGPLGRFYMGHISGKIANISLNSPGCIPDFDFIKDSTGSYIRRRLTLSPDLQRKHHLLNTVFFPDNPPFFDHRHCSGVLSAVFLALAFPPTGRRILPEGIRLAHIGTPPRHYGAHLRNVIVGAPAGARDMVNILRHRLLSKPRRPGFLVRNSAGKYTLHYHAEQEPNPESRVRLTDETDRFGLRRAFVDLRFTATDVQSVVASHRVLDQGLRAAGIACLEYRYPQEELADHVQAQASDGYHQTGTTRMGDDPTSSVVDSDLRAHGLENLHVASSSVFRTTGQANSTLPAVALGLRLVHHLHSRN